MRRSAIRKQLRIRGGQFRLWWLGVESGVARALRMRALYRRHLCALVEASGLFDAEWYLESNADVAASGMDALEHYVRFGDREGRQPMPLFDPAYYRAHAGAMPPGTNSLLHYLYDGRFRKVSPSAWFDVDFYLRQNRDVARSGEDPLRHYLREGGVAGRSPSRQFDAAFYLRTNPAVAAAGIDPLLHYLKFGRFENRPVLEGAGEEGAPSPAPHVPAELPEDWDDVALVERSGELLVDIVVPVYKGRNETLRCLRSVLLAANRTGYELIVINDASPDLELVETLERQARAGFFTLLHNPQNCGFVATANRGMSLHPDRDVVLLNSDTEVHGDWLDRLRASAWRHARTGTVTPLSNNATIASYPRFLHDNPYPLEISFAALDALAARVNHAVECEVPTGVGFCMYLRRDCLDVTGLFDEEAFGRGYGEENDLCQRAIAAGWRNIIAADVFVYHFGSVSFQGERAKRVADAMRVMGQRHPDYQRSVRHFMQDDPLRPARRRLDWARLVAGAREQNSLLVCHNRGGGAERHVREETARLLAEGVGVFYLRPVHGAPGKVRIADPGNMQLPNLGDFTLADTDSLAAALRELGITRIHNHGTVDFEPDAPDLLVSLARATGAAFEVDIHDYQVLCPRINLADESGRYCGEPAERDCDHCLLTQGNKFGVRSIRAWRESHARMLRAADTVWVPDEDVSRRLRAYYPELECAVAPHEEFAPGEPREPRLQAMEPLRIAVIGAIGKVKGFEVLLECARDAQLRRLPLEFSLLGYSMNDKLLRDAGVLISGRYLEADGAQKLAAMAPHVVWLPSLWPETYSYTLSLALQGGYPVFAFDIGAIGRRLRELGRDAHLVPLARQHSPREINRDFLDLRSRCIARQAVVAG